jgi:hypothetical protein
VRELFCNVCCGPNSENLEYLDTNFDRGSELAINHQRLRRQGIARRKGEALEAEPPAPRRRELGPLETVLVKVDLEHILRLDDSQASEDDHILITWSFLVVYCVCCGFWGGTRRFRVVRLKRCLRPFATSCTSLSHDHGSYASPRQSSVN